MCARKLRLMKIKNRAGFENPKNITLEDIRNVMRGNKRTLRNEKL